MLHIELILMKSPQKFPQWRFRLALPRNGCIAHKLRLCRVTRKHERKLVDPSLMPEARIRDIDVDDKLCTLSPYQTGDLHGP